jgi:hypothetical protein
MADLDVTIRIGGVDYTGESLAQARIVRGREDIYSVAQAAFASIQLFDDDGSGFAITVTLRVEIDIESGGTQVPLFTGFVSDISVSHIPTVNGSRSVWSMTATSSLATLNRRQILTEGAPSERDAERATRILRAGLSTTWEEFPAVAWEDTGSLRWNQIDPPVLTLPGGGDFVVNELPASAAGYNGYALLGELLASSGGSISEFGNGLLFYLSGSTRSALVDDAGYIELPDDIILADGFGTLQQASDLINVIEVSFDGGLVIRTDAASITQYGRRASVLSTILVDEADAVDRAEKIVDDFSQPRFKLPAIAFAAHSDPTELSALVEVQPSFPVDTGALPATIGTTNQKYFVEGIEWDLSPGVRTCRFYISDARLSIGPDA